MCVNELTFEEGFKPPPYGFPPPALCLEAGNYSPLGEKNMTARVHLAVMFFIKCYFYNTKLVLILL